MLNTPISKLYQQYLENRIGLYPEKIIGDRLFKFVKIKDVV